MTRVSSLVAAATAVVLGATVGAVGAMPSAPIVRAANASGWTIQPTPHPPAGTSEGLLGGLSCSAAKACTAVGYRYVHKSAPFALRWNGTTWRAQRARNPGHGASLQSVSCPSASLCIAVGSSSTGTVAERWHAGWKLLHPRNPSGAVDSQLAGISCPNTHTCVAVGSYRTSPGGYPFTLAERWNGHRWRIQHTPNPRGANGASAFGAVSCPTVGTCFAVGGSYTSSGEGVTLVERWHNGTWTIQHRPKKAHASDIHLQDVSCSSTTACTAVGYFAGAPRGEGTLVERWNGQRWVVQASPNPPNPAPSLDGVSCRNRTTCMAVGYFSVVTSISPSGRYHYKYSTLAELWDGHRWTLQRPPNPAKGTGPGLDGVACPTLSGCFSAGHYYPAKHHNAIWPLAERWQAS